MFSFSTTFIFTILALLSLVASAPIDARDVYVPPVLYPRAGTVWKAGSTHNVTWDTSNPPKQITNKNGMIVLAKGDYLVGLGKKSSIIRVSHADKHISPSESPLAKGFNILQGRQQVTIPADTEPGNDYSLVRE
ncbi:hypothetical protein H0H87_004434 [Tephrocybe sp. NHM501043]|nr:hypothetical protein H0H87_004434 [Tephrocybe sp. NHM501043]